jgi:hypothetical protein
MYARRQSGPWLLYDLEKDPYELHNLIETSSPGPLAQELDANLLQWMSKTGDSWKLDWPAPIEDNGHLYNYRTFYTIQEYLAWAKNHPYLAPGIN